MVAYLLYTAIKKVLVLFHFSNPSTDNAKQLAAAVNNFHPDEVRL